MSVLLFRHCAKFVRKYHAWHVITEASILWNIVFEKSEDGRVQNIDRACLSRGYKVARNPDKFHVLYQW